MKKTAKAGNIGRVSADSSDVIASLTTGETSVTFVDQGLLFVSGWMVIESSKRKCSGSASGSPDAAIRVPAAGARR